MRQAGVALIIRDGLILGISRRHNKDIFGVPGGKFDPEAGDKDTMDTAIRETKEETGIVIKDCVLLFERVELADSPAGEDFYARCYYATDWEGSPKDSEEGHVEWLTVQELTSTKAAFPDYNRNTLDKFKILFPNVFLKGE